MTLPTNEHHTCRMQNRKKLKRISKQLDTLPEGFMVAGRYFSLGPEERLFGGMLLPLYSRLDSAAKFPICQSWFFYVHAQQSTHLNRVVNDRF